MVFRNDEWEKQKEINIHHGRKLTALEQSLIAKDHAIKELFTKDTEHDTKLQRHEDMINSLSECVASIEKNSIKMHDYFDKNSKYFEIIIANMITVNVFTRNIKWLAGIIVAFGVIWKAAETLL